MVGSDMAGAPMAIYLGVCSSVTGTASTAAQFLFNGASREAGAFGNQFIALSQPDVVLNLDRLCFSEGWHNRPFLCHSDQRVP